MGNTHKDRWMRALPWVLLGKRVAFQPDLGTSPSILTFGKSVAIPGQVLGYPGPPLETEDTKNLLEELYKMAEKPAIQTSTTVNPIDISQTENATHVYIKVANPKSLCPKFEGPYPIESRPSRSQVKVRVGSYANGTPRHLTVHWSSCKIAHLRSPEVEGARKPRGRPKSDSPSDPEVESKLTAEPTNVNDESKQTSTHLSTGGDEGAKIQTSLRPIRASRNPHPNYISYIATPA